LMVNIAVFVISEDFSFLLSISKIVHK
jgi:hypothetical protein